MLHLRVVKQAQERLLESLILLCLFYLFFSSGLGLHCTLYIQNPSADRHLLVWNPIRSKKLSPIFSHDVAPGKSRTLGSILDTQLQFDDIH